MGRAQRWRKPMTALSTPIRQVLNDRREKLSAMMDPSGANQAVVQRLAQVDSALKRLDEGKYGICEVCAKQIDEPELIANPFLMQCVSHLPAEQLKKIFRDQAFAELIATTALPEDVLGKGITLAPWSSGNTPEIDQDIKRARDVQAELMPESRFHHEAWDIFYEFIPSGPLSGDYCDLVRVNPGEVFMMFGDAMGKGITACMTTCRLHALFRTLLELKLPLAELVDRANRIFCQCVQTSGHYATLLCGRATAEGTFELINAGHLPPLVLRDSGVDRVASAGTKGMPLGLFFDSAYEVSQVHVALGETLLCYTDGLTEARDAGDNEYGHERLAKVAHENRQLPLEELVSACREDIAAFTSRSSFTDDFTLLALRRIS
jgi:hypothetical protein